MSKTVLGVMTGQQVVLAPFRKWRWRVGEQDKVAVIAENWYQ
jgi:N-dimethylarginine dimethylaminohydrolase